MGEQGSAGEDDNVGTGEGGKDSEVCSWDLGDTSLGYKVGDHWMECKTIHELENSESYF